MPATMDCIDGIIDHGTNIHLPSMPDNFEEKDQGRHTFMGLIGSKVIGFDTDLEVFLGPYRTYANPMVVEQGKCTNSKSVGDNPCGTLQTYLNLESGESIKLTVILGIGSADKEGKEAIQTYSKPGKIEASFQKLKEYWHQRLQGFHITTPDRALNSMMNMWNPFNCLITYSWSRTASLVYAGARDGLGYRDTLQDLIGVIPLIPDEASKRLELMITGQVSSGGALPVVKPFDHHPGHENPPENEAYRSDDALWLFNAIPAYVKETGNLAFFDKILPYADQGKDTVLNHMKKAILFSIKHSGKHGLPCGLSADWNDCLRLGYHGESVFVAFQLRYALRTYIEICSMLKKQSEVKWADNHLNKLDNNLKKYGWDGNWFIRAITENSMKLGSKENDEGSIFLNPQTWAVYSGHATTEQAKKCLNAVHDQLYTEYGIMLCAPPFEKTDFHVVRATFFNKGMKENCSIFCHTHGWAVIAEALLGHGNQAYQYFCAFLPAAYNTRAEIRQIEPYVYCQSTHSKFSPRAGASRLPWLSGSATWSYHAMTQYILGIQPDYGGLRIDPCIPSDWKEYTVERKFRGRLLRIKVNNPAGVENGVKKMKLNREELDPNYIPFEKLQDNNEIEVTME
jgi:N,N'-diacetylchitobiose phosphorylase